VEFTAAERPRAARWSLEPRGGFVTALDDEARWLGLPEDDGGPALAGVSALPPHRSNQHPSRPQPPEQDDTDLLLDNLSERRGQRPARRSTPDNDLPDMMELDLDGPGGPQAEEPEPAPEPSAAVVDIGARRSGSRPKMPEVKVPDSPADLEWEGPSQWEIPTPEPAAEEKADETPPADNPAPRAEPDKPPEKPAEQAPPKRPAAKRGRKSRAQVPSWDEIVFGSRPEV
jgi:hypothetical protein